MTIFAPPESALVVGGSRGIGLAIATDLVERGCEAIWVAGRREPDYDAVPADLLPKFKEAVRWVRVDLSERDFSLPAECLGAGALYYTAGIGRVAPVEDLSDSEVERTVLVDELAAIKVLRAFWGRLRSADRFPCAVMASIAGRIASPLFSAYSAAKGGLRFFVEAANAELAAQGSGNRILEVSPGRLEGTSFEGGRTSLERIAPVAAEVVERSLVAQTLWIPSWDETYANVMRRYLADPEGFAAQSYEYKLPRATGPQKDVVGYLSGTFDLFHIGHLNLLRRAHAQCDKLVVGVHKSGAWKGKETFIPFEERLEIVRACRYVDEAVESWPEDCDAWDTYHYDKLFVGSDYEGTERFARYEAELGPKGVQIVYFPYTQGTSSTQLRAALKQACVAPAEE